MKLLTITGHSQYPRAAVAIATAAAAAAAGQRVLLASSGPVHCLSELLNEDLGPRPRELSANFAAMEISALDEAGTRWDALRPTFRSGLAARLRDIGPEELPSFPGLDAVGAVLVAERARAAGQFDLLVLDGPSPDNLIRTLSLPDALRWLLRLVFGLDRGPGRSRASQEAAMIPASLIAPNALAPLQDLRVALEEQRAKLNPSNGARVRLVVSPEEAGLRLTRETLVGLGIYGLEVDMLLAVGAGGVAAADRASFAPANDQRPLLVSGALPLQAESLAVWAEYGQALYGSTPLVGDAPPRASSNEREVRLAVPFIDAKGLDVAMASEEVIIRLGQFRRHLLLPALAGGGKLRARVDNEVLRLWVE